VKANRAYHLIAARDGLEPAFMATEARLDRIEIVSIDDGEVALFWDVPAKLASRLLKELRADLAGMEAEAFIDKWTGADAEDLFE
jgi:hypothetical protein